MLERLTVISIELAIYLVAATTLKILECPLTLEDRKFEQWVE